MILFSLFTTNHFFPPGYDSIIQSLTKLLVAKQAVPARKKFHKLPSVRITAVDIDSSEDVSDNDEDYSPLMKLGKNKFYQLGTRLVCASRSYLLMMITSMTSASRDS